MQHATISLITTGYNSNCYCFGWNRLKLERKSSEPTKVVPVNKSSLGSLGLAKSSWKLGQQPGITSLAGWMTTVITYGNIFFPWHCFLLFIIHISATDQHRKKYISWRSIEIYYLFKMYIILDDANKLK